MPDLPAVLWFGFGHCLSVTRDGAGCAMRDFLISAVNMAGTLRVSGVCGWLEAVRMPPALTLLDEAGVGPLRRAGRLAELDDLASGDAARVRRVLTRGGYCSRRSRGLSPRSLAFCWDRLVYASFTYV